MLKNNPQLKQGWKPELIQISEPLPINRELSVLSNNLTRQINKALQEIQARMELMRQVPGIVKAYLTEVTGDYTITDKDYAVVVELGGLTTITLPSAALVESQVFVIKNNGSGVVNVVGSDLFEVSETILQLNTSDSAMLYSTGSKWVII